MFTRTCSVGYECEQSADDSVESTDDSVERTDGSVEAADDSVEAADDSVEAADDSIEAVDLDMDEESLDAGLDQSVADFDTLTREPDTGVLDGNFESDTMLPETLERIEHTSGECTILNVVGPVLPNEAGHFAAVRFDFVQSAFEVQNILYSLRGAQDQAGCSAELEHKVHVFVIEANEPLPARPQTESQLFRAYDTPFLPVGLDGRRVRLTLPTPMPINTGDSLVIAIEMSASQNQHLCLEACGSQTSEPGRYFWSNAAEPPFAWQDLVDDYSPLAVGLEGRTFIGR